MAGPGSPCSANQAAARSWPARSTSGRVIRSSRRRSCRNSWWYRYHSRSSSSGTKRFSASTRRSRSPASPRPVTRRQVGVHPLQHRGGEQEVADLLRLPVEDLVEEEVGHVPVAAGEALDELVDVGAAGEGQRGEVEAGRPALGPLDEALDLPAVEPHGREAGEEVDGLVDLEAQVGLPQLDDLAVEAGTVQVDGRVRP